MGWDYIHYIKKKQCRSVKSLSSMPLWYIHVNTICHSQMSLSWMPLCEYFILNATLWNLYRECHSDIFIMNVTLWCLYPQCHSDIYMYMYILNATLMFLSWMPLSDVFIPGDLWYLYPKCHLELFILNAASNYQQFPILF